MRRFEGKKILVTGVGQGIGRSLAIKLVKEGAEVWGVSKTQANLDTLKDECPQIHTICQDLSDWNGVHEALKDFPAMDGLVNNAGMGILEPFLEVTEEAWDR